MDTTKKKLISRRAFCKNLTIGTVGFATLAGTGYTRLSSGASLSDGTTKKIPFNLPRRAIGNTGMYVSVLGLGAGSRFWNNSHLPRELWEDYVHRALAVEGINYIDTAINYGSNQESEKMLGTIVQCYRNDLILSSKTPQRHYDGVMRDIETSLTNLKTDYLDVYLMHNLGQNGSETSLRQLENGYNAILKLKEQGVVKAIGFSSHSAVPQLVSQAVDHLDIDLLLLSTNNMFNYKPHIESIADRGVAVSTIKVMMPIEGQNPSQTGKTLLRGVLDLPVCSAVITHRTQDVFDSNLTTIREYAAEQGIDMYYADFSAQSQINDFTFIPSQTNFQLQQDKQRSVLSLKTVGPLYSNPRRPRTYALVNNKIWKEAEVTINVRYTDTLGTPDIIIPFAYQDEHHWCYAHISNRADNFHNVIMKVDGSNRYTIHTERTRSPLQTKEYYRIKLVFNADKGSVCVYCDDDGMQEPFLVASNATFAPGLVGLGSFDTLALFDNLEIHGKVTT